MSLRGRQYGVGPWASFPYYPSPMILIWERPPGWLVRDAKLNSRSDYAVSRIG